MIELKRTEDGGHMELQAIRYAAMVSTMTFEKIVDVHAGYLRKIGSGEDAQASILEFLEWEEPDENRFAQDVRIVLASAEFSRELTTAVIWLNERNIDIRCIRLKPYKDNGRVLIDVQQVIPLPEAAAYQVQIREKEQVGRQDRAERYSLRLNFWGKLLNRAEHKTSLHITISPTEYNWLGTKVGRGLGLNYVVRQHEGTVELYIDRGAGETENNKKIFDALVVNQDAIEQAFSGPLLWERLDGKQACRISYTITAGGYRDEESKWPEIHDTMIDAMIRLERALNPHLSKLKNGM